MAWSDDGRPFRTLNGAVLASRSKPVRRNYKAADLMPAPSCRPLPAPPKACIGGADRFADGFENLRGRTRLGQQGERRILHRLFHEFTAGVRGVNYNRGRTGPTGPDFAQDGRTVNTGPGQINYDNVRDFLP